MRITKAQLNQLIKEEVKTFLKEQVQPTTITVGGGSDPEALELYLVRGEVRLPDGTIVSTHFCPGHRIGPNQWNGLQSWRRPTDVSSSISGGNVVLTFPNGLDEPSLRQIQDYIIRYGSRILGAAPTITVTNRGNVGGMLDQARTYFGI